MRHILSVTAAAAGDNTCNLHLRWSDGEETMIGQNDELGLYTASAAQRTAAVARPATNSEPWCDWFLGYATAYDKAHGEPPQGYVAPAASVEPQTVLFPKATEGIPPVTDPVILRRRELQEMDPPAYKAVAKALGIVGFSRMRKDALVEAILAAEASGKTAESAPTDHEPAEGSEGGPPAAGEENHAESQPSDDDRIVSESVARLLAPKTAAQVIGGIAYVGITPTPHDLRILQAADVAERARKQPRKAVLAALADRIVALSPQMEPEPAPAEPTPVEPEPIPVESVPTIVDGPVRPEVGGEGLGGVGVEMTGGMGLGGGVELGGLGTGAGELTGGLAGESVGMGGAGQDAPAGVPERKGAGCKQPDKVDGWVPGRVLVVVKPHRGEYQHWGTCEYRVRCDEDGGYTLLKLDGNRTAKDVGNLFEGKKWAYVSPMLTDLMGIPLDAKGKPTRHHRMTLRRWFALNRSTD